jgi:hypothetical protein
LEGVPVRQPADDMCLFTWQEHEAQYIHIKMVQPVMGDVEAAV